MREAGMLDFLKNYETWVRGGIVLFAAIIVALAAYYFFIKYIEHNMVIIKPTIIFNPDIILVADVFHNQKRTSSN